MKGDTWFSKQFGIMRQRKIVPWGEGRISLNLSMAG